MRRTPAAIRRTHIRAGPVPRNRSEPAAMELDYRVLARFESVLQQEGRDRTTLSALIAALFYEQSPEKGPKIAISGEDREHCTSRQGAAASRSCRSSMRRTTCI